MTWVMWNLSSFYLEVVLASMQDRCMVCTRRTIASEIILDALMVPIADEAQVEDHFGHLDIVQILMQDRCTVCDERTIGSEINLDTPDRTPR